MYYLTSLNELYYTRKVRKLPMVTVYNRHKNAWAKVGVYTQKAINSAIEEGTLIEISRRQANNLLTIEQRIYTDK